MNTALQLVLGLNAALVITAPFILAAHLTSPGGMRQIELWLASGVVLALAIVVPRHARRILQPRLQTHRGLVEQPLVQVTWIVTCYLLVGLVPTSSLHCFWILLPLVAAVWGIWSALRRSVGESRSCMNCGFDARGNQTERCPDCGFISAALARYRGVWCLATFPIDPVFGNNFEIVLSSPDFDEPLNIGGCIALDPSVREGNLAAWRCQADEPVVFFHELRDGELAVLPAAYADESGQTVLAFYPPDTPDDGSDPYSQGWRADPDTLEKRLFLTLLGENVRAIERI